jgi:hypothetical protein
MIETILRERNPSGSAPSSGNQYLAVGSSVSPYLIIYKRNGDTYTKIADPASMPPTGVTGVAWNGSTHLACAHSNYPYVTVYKRSGDTFTKLADFTTNEGSATTGHVRFNQHPELGASTRMAFNYSVPPYFKLFSLSGDTFSMYANPSALPGNAVPPNADLNFQQNLEGEFLAIASGGIFVYTTANPPVRITQSMATSVLVRAVSADFAGYTQIVYTVNATVYYYDMAAGPYSFTAASPATLALGGACLGALERDPIGTGYLFAGIGISPFFRAYFGPFSYNQFALSADPPGAVIGISVTAAVNPTVACAHAASPYVTIYNFDGAATMTKVADPAVLPPGAATCVAFSGTF